MTEQIALSYIITLGYYTYTKYGDEDDAKRSSAKYKTHSCSVAVLKN